MNRLSRQQRVRVASALVEGNSIRATVRMTGVAKNTVVKLLRDLGAACQAYHDEHVRGLTCEHIQTDEIWSFCYCKQANVPAQLQGQEGVGDVWTWTAIDADTKLVATWIVGLRDADTARDFMFDLADRLADRTQLSTDGLSTYVDAVQKAFGDEIDFAQIVKQYAAKRDPGHRYSPPVCTGCHKRAISGDPDPEHVSTSYVERQNLTMRMSMRRFTRLTNAFSKKLENLEHAVALHFMYYNFCRKHQTLRQTPAQAAALADHQWGIDELAGLLKTAESN